jgi:hypothetical protein
VKLKLDLHDIFNKGTEIDKALRGIIDEAIQKEIKQLYHRVEKDGDNWGRLFIHFRFESGQDRGRRRR